MKIQKQSPMEGEEEVQIEESQDFINGAAREEEVQLEIPHDLRGGGYKERKKGILEQEKVEAIPAPEEMISKIQHLEIEPQTKLVGEDIGIAKQNVDIEPFVSVQIGITKLQ